MNEQTNDYAKLTDDERKGVLWHLTTLNIRAKAKRKAMKEATPDCSAAEYKMDLDNIGADIRANNAEIKKLLAAAGVR